MRRIRTRRPAPVLAAGLAAALLSVTVPAAHAEAPPPAHDASRAVRTEPVPIPGTHLVRGRSTLVVDAPVSRVRAAIRAFSRYPEFMPHFRTCRIIGRSPSGGRDLYLEVEALHGAVKMWARVDAMKPAEADGVETHAIRFLEGNVRELSATWRLRPLSGSQTELSLEIFLHPRLPLPVSLLNSENLDGSARGVQAIRARSER
ncbi:MAG TPA: SRPBCC family protein [Candidatus Nanopelagicales bacterium]|nr:SRPBCC family protein [Candidatus Nanopelagicales bacterium]